mmetsp:Transcript_20242/g.44182  ORF Transcript_20242/g.44182 Transcript_20242/m.44182 type:complete len:208 (-) Transcript_20242:876-1499(-)
MHTSTCLTLCRVTHLTHTRAHTHPYTHHPYTHTPAYDKLVAHPLTHTQWSAQQLHALLPPLMQHVLDLSIINQPTAIYTQPSQPNSSPHSSVYYALVPPITTTMDGGVHRPRSHIYSSSSSKSSWNSSSPPPAPPASVTAAAGAAAPSEVAPACCCCCCAGSPLTSAVPLPLPSTAATASSGSALMSGPAAATAAAAAAAAAACSLA